jgi:hypothetical protein
MLSNIAGIAMLIQTIAIMITAVMMWSGARKMDKGADLEGRNPKMASELYNQASQFYGWVFGSAIVAVVASIVVAIPTFF